VGVDPRLLSVEDARKLQERLGQRGISLRFVVENLVDILWHADRPALPSSHIRVLSDKFAGETVASKLSRLLEEMARFHADAHVISALDSIAWLFNLRGNDIPYNPVFISYALVTREEASLFVDLAKVTEEVRTALGPEVSFRPYSAIGDALSRELPMEWKVWIDPNWTSQWVYQLLQGHVSPFDRQSPTIAFKAVKNPVERDGMRSCHVRDGVAMVKFLRCLELEVAGGTLTELSAAAHLNTLRAEGENYQGLSFETVMAYQDHGAVIHYRPSEETDCRLAPRGLLLVDSGGQYLDGTTDITRTLALGTPSTIERERFTRVLKGHIALARSRFPKGTTGRQLETLARSPLWEAGLDYRHGTGHGVGAFLNVHEGPQSISPRDTGVALEPGMFVSNEPGYYEAGAYGIRIESVMMIVEEPALDTEYGPFYGFEVVSMVPIDLNLIDPLQLTPQERAWLNAYHVRVRELISPHLSGEDLMWLASATRLI
jgi:Xaa-Pro aminopeptidase